MPENALAHDLNTFLRQRFPALPADLHDETSLLDSGAVDSLGILEIVGFIEERCGIVLADEDITPENFATVGRLQALIRERRNGA